MVRNLRFAHRVWLMPGLAGAGLVVILVVAQVLGARTGAALTGIQQGFLPALETARDLQEALAAIQRGLQDAATARDAGLLGEADQQHELFLGALAKAEGNPVIPAAQRQAIANAVNVYYKLARANTQSAIGGAIPESLRTQIDQYNEIRRILASFTAQSRRDMEAAFESARSNQRLSITIISVLTVVIVLVLATLSWLIIRSLTGPLTEVVDAAGRLARGDMSATIEVRSRDEIGALSLAMQQLLASLREMARVADAIAEGDLRGEIEPRSASDAFGHAFRTMIANLRQILGDAKSSAAQVAATAEEISASALEIKHGAASQSASTEETSATMVEMATQLDSVNRSTQALASNVEETSTSMQQMGASIEEVAKRDQRLLASVQETAATIEEMTSSIESIPAKVNVVDEVSRQATAAATEGGERLSGVILGIGASGKDIGQIVRLIDDIDDQN